MPAIDLLIGCSAHTSEKCRCCEWSIFHRAISHTSTRPPVHCGLREPVPQLHRMRSIVTLPVYCRLLRRLILVLMTHDTAFEIIERSFMHMHIHFQGYYQ